MQIDYGSDGVFKFVQFDLSFDGRRCRVHVYIFPFVFWGMSVLLPFVTFRTWDWKEFVGSLVLSWKLLASVKSVI